MVVAYQTDSHPIGPNTRSQGDEMKTRNVRLKKWRSYSRAQDDRLHYLLRCGYDAPTEKIPPGLGRVLNTEIKYRMHRRMRRWEQEGGD